MESRKSNEHKKQEKRGTRDTMASGPKRRSRKRTRYNPMEADSGKRVEKARKQERRTRKSRKTRRMGRGRETRRRKENKTRWYRYSLMIETSGELRAQRETEHEKRGKRGRGKEGTRPTRNQNVVFVGGNGGDTTRMVDGAWSGEDDGDA